MKRLILFIVLFVALLSFVNGEIWYGQNNSIDSFESASLNTTKWQILDPPITQTSGYMLVGGSSTGNEISVVMTNNTQGINFKGFTKNVTIYFTLASQGGTGDDPNQLISIANANATSSVNLDGAINISTATGIEIDKAGQRARIMYGSSPQSWRDISGLATWFVYFGHANGASVAGNWGLKVLDLNYTIPGEVNLVAPANNSVLSTSYVFNISSSPANNYSLANVTIYLYNQTGGLFNKTTNNLTGLSLNYTSFNISFGSQTFTWGVYVCSTNECKSSSNFSFTSGYTENSRSFNASVIETTSQGFTINITTLSNVNVQSATLVYNGTNYTGATKTQTGNSWLISKQINIPAGNTGFNSESRSFYWTITLNDLNYGTTAFITTNSSNQTVTELKLELCSQNVNVSLLRFTLYDERTGIQIPAGTNNVTFQASFNYGLSTSSLSKNYSINNVSVNVNNFTFCSTTNSSTIYTDMESDFEAYLYRPNTYFLDNAPLFPPATNISLYLLSENDGTKFFLTFRSGNSLLTNAIVTVQKFFTGLGQYQTVAILQSDEVGETTMWQEVDADYRYTVIQGAEIIGVQDKRSICAVAPCALSITFTESSTSALAAYGTIYANGTLSSITYNRTNDIVTYTFIDTTGLATYFRLQVNKLYYNQSGPIVCDSTLYSSAGSITCNLSDETGEFIATGYISRSPELIDITLNIITDESIIEQMGLEGIFIIIGILITAVFAAAVIGRGSPTTVLWFFGLTILGLKLIGLFPFTWPIVITLEVIIGFMIHKIKV